MLAAAAVLLAAAAAVAIGIALYHRGSRQRQERRIGDLAGILAMDGRRFDAFIARLYRKDGWWAFEPHAASERSGVDIRLERGGETWLVRTRNWRFRNVDVAEVREFYGLLVERGASGGFFVTSSAYTMEAQTFARRVPRTRPLGLIDRDELLAWARRGRVAARGPRAAPPPELVLESFRELHPAAFRRQVLDAWRRQGYATADAGEPVLTVERDGERLLVQCLAGDAGEPALNAVQPLLEAAARDRLGGVAVSAVELPESVRRQLNARGLDVIEGERLARFLAAGTSPPEAVASSS